jgi:hypothetical protein
MDVTRVGQGVERIFTGKVGEQVSEVVTKTDNSDNGSDSLTLLDPEGDIVDSSSSGGDGIPVGVGPDTLTHNGKYTVLYQVDNVATGTGILWVSKPVSLGKVKVNGPTAQVDVTRVGQAVERTFTGTPGEKIRADVTGISNSDNGSDSLTLFAPNGDTVDSCSSGGDGVPCKFGTDTLSQKGTYVFFYELDNTATGTGKLAVTS